MNKSDLREVARQEFKFIVDTYILPLLPTPIEKIDDGEHYINDPQNISPNKHIKFCPIQKWIDIYPAPQNPQFHFRISSHDTPNVRAAEFILNEIMRVSQYDYSDPNFSQIKYHDHDIKGTMVYRNTRFNLAYEVGLCMWLGGISVFRLLEKMNTWSQKTYEGQRMSFSFIIDATKMARGENDYIRFLDSSHSAVFTDGMSSGIALDNDGYIVKYFTTNDSPQLGSNGLHELNNEHLTLAPYRFQDFANRCYPEKGGPTWIGIISQANGDILIFKQKKIIFTKRNGEWRYIDSHRIFSIIADYLRVDEERKLMYAKQIYLSLLDSSFSHTGGCIAIIDEQHKKTVIEEFFPDDDLECVEPGEEKKCIIKRLINSGDGNDDRSFFSLDRKLRQDMLSLDGATIIDHSGKILGVGAIVKIDGGSEEGGRTAAAKQLAPYGLAIKISMDGRIHGYRSNTDNSSLVEKVFTLF